MALDDILSAITQETDNRIADAKNAHKKRLALLREQSDSRILNKKQETDAQLNEKKKLMQSKAEMYITLQKRNAILRKKQELLTRCYSDVVNELTKLKPATAEKLLKHFLDSIKGKGEIRPTKLHKELLEKLADSERVSVGKSIDAAGGFVFVSDTQEFDYTFENLVENHLRPRTEVQVSNALFNA